MASTFQQTRSAIAATPGWIAHAIQTLLGSRFFVAVLGVFFIAFLAHVTTAPDRLPPITRVDLVRIAGFAPPVGPAPDLLPSQAKEDAERLARSGVPYLQPYLNKAKAAATTYQEAHPQAIFYANCIGLGLSSFFLLLGLYLLARQESTRRYG